MLTAPVLTTNRLILRSFTLEDASDVQRLAGERDVAATTCAIPHPYKDGMAEKWIGSHSKGLKNGSGIVYAITLKDTHESDGPILIGAIDIRIDQAKKLGELGYWVGKPYWGCGYCTEAAKVILSYGFDVLKLRSIHAFYFKQNRASGRVLEKIGMQFEAEYPRAAEKWGVSVDLVKYCIHNKTYNSR